MYRGQYINFYSKSTIKLVLCQLYFWAGVAPFWRAIMSLNDVEEEMDYDILYCGPRRPNR